MMNSTPTNAKALREQGQSEITKNSKDIISLHYGDVNQSDLSTAAQRQRLLEALQKGPITTLEARKHLEILHPAMRILELKKAGHRIDTLIIRQATDKGIKHRVAQYVLQSKAETSLTVSSYGGD